MRQRGSVGRRRCRWGALGGGVGRGVGGRRGRRLEVASRIAARIAGAGLRGQIGESIVEHLEAVGGGQNGQRSGRQLGSASAHTTSD